MPEGPLDMAGVVDPTVGHAVVVIATKKLHTKVDILDPVVHIANGLAALAFVTAPVHASALGQR